MPEGRGQMAVEQEVFSISRITMFAECPRKYRFQYIEHRQRAFESVEAVLGQVVHGALAWLYTERQSGRKPSVGDLVGRFLVDWRAAQGPHVKVIKSGETTDTHSSAGAEMLTQYYETRFRRDSLDTIAVEDEFTLLLAQKYRVTGVVDRLARDRDGTLVVIDYKTTRNPPPVLDEEAALQLRWYGVGALVARNAERVRLEYQYLRTGNSHAFALSAGEERNRVVRTLMSRIDGVMTASSWPARPSSLCDWCGFSPICPEAGGRSGGRLRTDDGVSCPECAGALERRHGRNGFFIGCTRYPECRYSRDVDAVADADHTSNTCPRCGGDLELRHGRKGPFLGCENFPECRYSRDA